MSDPVQAITINYLYDVVTDVYRVRVSFTPVGGSKVEANCSFTPAELVHMDKEAIAFSIADRYYDLLCEEWGHDTAYFVSTYAFKALQKEYQNKYEWNTHWGGNHVYSGPIPKVGKWTATNNEATINGVAVDELAYKLPGANTRVQYPCDCKGSDGNVIHATLYTAIMHLNDTCRWTRESIADWIDKLHDDGIINAEFQPWEADSPDQKPDMSAVNDKTQQLENACATVSNAFNDLITEIKKEETNDNEDKE